MDSSNVIETISWCEVDSRKHLWQSQLVFFTIDHFNNNVTSASDIACHTRIVYQEADDNCHEQKYPQNLLAFKTMIYQVLRLETPV